MQGVAESHRALPWLYTLSVIT